jgi:hypothetical protein
MDGLLVCGRGAVGIMMWAWTIGAFFVAAIVHQIAIALCRRAQVCTEPDQYEQWPSEPQSRHRSRVRRVADPPDAVGGTAECSVLSAATSTSVSATPTLLHGE